VLRSNAKVKLRLWLNFWQQNSAIAMNAVVTSHLLVCLYSAVGKKVNRQSLLHRTNSRSHPLNGGPQNPKRRTCMVGPLRARKLYCFPATSSGKVFFGPSASRSLRRLFFMDQARYEKRSSAVKGLLLGPCFVAEGPAGRNTFGKACLYVISMLPLVKLWYYGVSEDEGSNRLKGGMTF
jgi:hypothetical protein